MLEKVYLLKGGLNLIEKNDKLMTGVKMSITNKKAVYLEKIFKGKQLTN